MAKIVHNDVLDAALNLIKDNANQLCVCATQPTTRDEAITTYKLAITSTGSGDFTVGEGDGQGRKCAVAQKATITVDSSGSAQHIALVDSTRLLYVTTCTMQYLTSGNTVTVPTWDIQINDPTP